MAVIVNPLLDPPSDYAQYFAWWQAVLKPRLTLGDQLLWPQISTVGADPADIGAASTAALAVTNANVTTVTSGLATHIADATDVHGATGTTLGTGNQASTLTRGPVLQAAAVADSTATVTSANAGAAYTAAEQTLINEMKADINALVATVNDILQTQRDAEQRVT